MKILLNFLILNTLLIYPQDFLIKTNFPDSVIVNTVNVEKSTNTIFAGTYDGVYKSADLGNSWFEINNGISGRKIINHFLVIDTLNIYASTFDGLFKTTDGGQNWNLLQIGLGNVFCKLLRISEFGDFFVASGDGIYRSTDNGSSWQKIFFTGGIVNTIILDSDSTIYSHQVPELFKSSDYGNTWKFIYQFSVGSYVYNLQSGLVIEWNNILFGTDGGIFYTPDGGSSFFHNSVGIGLTSILDLLKDEGDHIFAVSWDDKIFLTIDYSKSWISYSTGLQNSNPTSITSDKYGYLFLGTFNGGIYKSIVSTSKFLPDKRIINFYSNLNTFYSDSILIKNKSDSTLVVSDIFITDPDYSVTPQNLSLNSGDSTSIIISYYPTESNLDTARIIFENNSFLATEIIWLNGYAGIPVLEIPFLTLSFGDVEVGETKDTIIYLSNVGVDTLLIDSLTIDDPSFGIEYSNSYILPFDTLSVKISFSPSSIAYYKAKLLLYSNNYSSPDSILFRGFGINPLNTPKNDKTDLSFELFQNYPNPFNPRTNIKYSVGKNSFVSLKVYDILGNEIATLVHEQKPVGRYMVEFDASKLPSGIYIYSMIAEKYKETRKIVLLK